MANQEHLDILKQGKRAWNRWRKEQANIRPVLSSADLSHNNLFNIDLSDADLNDVDFSFSDLRFSSFYKADLSDAYLIGTNLQFANLSEANLYGADLTEADLSEAILIDANFNRTDLSETNLSGAMLARTIFENTDLSQAKGLETVMHHGPSVLSVSTVYRSHGNIPKVFLRGIGVPENFIEIMHSLVGKPFDYHSCFISYSSKDEDFARRLHADLQEQGVRCWFASEDMNIGDKIRPRIEESIRLYDKLLLVLSEHSIASNWVAYEVEKALNKEPEGVPNVLYPIRLDDAVMQCEAEWADDIRRTRHIGDFTHWKNHDDYQKAFSRLLRALKAGG